MDMTKKYLAIKTDKLPIEEYGNKIQKTGEDLA